MARVPLFVFFPWRSGFEPPPNIIAAARKEKEEIDPVIDDQVIKISHDDQLEDGPD